MVADMVDLAEGTAEEVDMEEVDMVEEVTANQCGG
jgi:hypothetical protein